MNINMSASRIKRHYKGFTLTETVIAMAIVGLLLTAFVGVFIPARKSVQATLALQEADRISSALSSELAVLKPGEQNVYRTAFEKAFDWMQKTKDASTAILIYNYRGDLSKPPRTDGSLQPFTKGASVPGSETLVLPSVILASDSKRLEQDSVAIVGPIFLVRMTQLVWSDRGADSSSNEYGGTGGKYVLAARPGVITSPFASGGQVVTKAADYVYDASSRSQTPWGAEVLYQAEFFQMPVMQVKGATKLRYENLREPVFKRCMAFRR